MEKKENLYDLIKLIRVRHGYVIHIKTNGKWLPMDEIIVPEIYDPSKEKEKKFWKFW